ncbi:MAG: methyltransferase domain-containing protein [Saonia sp.]
MDLSLRSTEPELMDDPAIAEDILTEVLKDIDRSNRMLGGNRVTIKEVGRLIAEYPRESYTIVDMGCGDGSMLREVALFCRKHHINVSLIGVDLSDKAIGIAKEASTEFSEIRFLQQNILDLKANDLGCDIMLCTLTMHHFTNEQIPIFLKQFIKLAKIGVVINDLERSISACYLFMVFRAIFIKSQIAKYDGLISIKSGFTKRELRVFSKDFPEVHHTILWKWAFRYVWVIRTCPLITAYERD